jgi:hypothetical protein
MITRAALMVRRAAGDAVVFEGVSNQSEMPDG